MERFFSFIFVACVVLSTHSSTSQAQENLVPNPGFEDYGPCPTDDTGFNLVSNWFTPNQWIPDYLNECAGNNAIFGVPQNEFGDQPANGAGYIGLISYFFSEPQVPNTREFASIALSEPLIAGNVYCVSFKVNLAEESAFAVDEIGLLISEQNPSNIDLMNETPQIHNSSTADLQNTENWVNISGNYTAIGNEQFLTIGNFKTDDETTQSYINPGGENASIAYYYIDDVILIESIALNLTIDLGEDDSICQSSRTLGLEQEFASYEWQDKSTNDTYQAKETGLYYVIVEDACGNSTQDSINLEFQDCSDFCLKFPNAFSPNGDGHNDFFKGRVCEVTDITLLIFNRWGELIFETNNPQDEWDGTYQNKVQPVGVYLWSVQYIDPTGLPREDKGFVALLR